MSAPGESILDNAVLPTIDLSTVDLTSIPVDYTCMTTHGPCVGSDDVITISGTPNASPGYITTPAIDWSDITTNINWNQGTSNIMELRGKDADLRINGVSLTETLQGIQDRLAILRPNPELESRWQQLRDLREQYQALEQELQEKEQAWAALQQAG